MLKYALRNVVDGDGLADEIVEELLGLASEIAHLVFGPLLVKVGNVEVGGL